MRRSARAVDEALERLPDAPEFEFAEIVGYSMGELVATYVLECTDRGRRVRRVVTLRTPHPRTPVAACGVLACSTTRTILDRVGTALAA